MALDYEVKKLINDMSGAVRELYGISGPILDIDEAVRRMGGTVTEDPSIDGFSDGRIRKTGPKTFEIAVSPFQTEERRNFTIAHELGHLFLHMGFQTNEVVWSNHDSTPYYRNGNSEREYQSNEFAAAFLMPQEDYKHVMDQYTNGKLVQTAEIARHFHVSVDAAANRGKWLGYLRW